jgi:peptidoglycan/xylan/chitin deacetylase (PgdA/CDA1 family)
MSAALAIAAPLAAAGALAGLTYGSVAPSCRLWGPVISRGPAGTNRVALTFDDGPTSGTTDRVLDELARADARATFFVVGANVELHADLLRRIHEQGHLIANHTFGHSHFGVMRRWPYWEREIRVTDERIETAVGVRPALFRPPMGARTWHTAIAAKRLGHTVVTWSQRARDGFPTTAEQIRRRLAGVRDGDILLLHDGVEPHTRHGDRSATIAAAGPLIGMLRDRGLTPARLDDLLGLPGYQSRAASTVA